MGDFAISIWGGIAECRLVFFGVETVPNADGVVKDVIDDEGKDGQSGNHH